jgi:hypothetical protein
VGDVAPGPDARQRRIRVRCLAREHHAATEPRVEGALHRAGPGSYRGRQRGPTVSAHQRQNGHIREERKNDVVAADRTFVVVDPIALRLRYEKRPGWCCGDTRQPGSRSPDSRIGGQARIRGTQQIPAERFFRPGFIHESAVAGAGVRGSIYGLLSGGLAECSMQIVSASRSYCHQILGIVRAVTWRRDTRNGTFHDDRLFPIEAVRTDHVALPKPVCGALGIADHRRQRLSKLLKAIHPVAEILSSIRMNDSDLIFAAVVVCHLAFCLVQGSLLQDLRSGRTAFEVCRSPRELRRELHSFFDLWYAALRPKAECL